MLSDPVIRAAFLEKLNKAHPRPKAIIEELRVHNGNAIADIVAIYNEAHCYEIKGDSDKVERITEQGKYYDLAFRKVTLITTSKHAQKATTIAPPHWGIIEAREGRSNKIIFRSIRPAGRNINFNKKIALLTLWRDELVDIAINIEEKLGTKINRDSLSLLISQAYNAQELSLRIGEALVLRNIIKHEA